MPKRKSHNSLGLDDNCIGSEYDQEEVDFIKAMDLYCIKAGRRFPTCSEVLKVVKSMGYVKVADTQPIPVYHENASCNGASNG